MTSFLIAPYKIDWCVGSWLKKFRKEGFSSSEAILEQVLIKINADNLADEGQAFQPVDQLAFGTTKVDLKKMEKYSNFRIPD